MTTKLHINKLIVNNNNFNFSMQRYCSYKCKYNFDALPAKKNKNFFFK